MSKIEFGISGILLFVFYVLLGCSSPPREQVSLDVVVQRNSGTSALTVSYRSSRPVDGLVFVRTGNIRRGKNWRAIKQDLAGANIGPREILISRGGPRTQFDFEVPAYLHQVVNDYPFFSTFSDGGLVVFTGYLQAYPIYCDIPGCRSGRINEDTSVETRFLFRPAQGENVGVEGSFSPLQVAWSGSEQGTLVYFGSRLPVDTPNFSFLADSDLPQWLSGHATDYLPRFLELYSARFGSSLPRKPFVFLAVDREEASPDSSEKIHGSVVGGQMVVSISGEPWNESDGKRRETFLKVLAHEAAHFWNAFLFKSSSGPDGLWLHEGSADAFALAALFETGVLSRKGYFDAQTEALNRCAVGLIGQTLSDLSRAGATKTPYHCGAVLNFIAGSTASPDDPEGGLFALWKELFARAAASNSMFDPELFLATLAVHDPQGVVSALARVLIESSMSAPDDFFRSILPAAGIESRTRSTQFPEWYSEMMGTEVTARIVSQDCNGLGYYVQRENGIELIGSSVCTTIKKEMPVASLDHYHLYKEGVKAYDYAYEQCRSSGQVHFWGAQPDDVLELRCEPIPKRPVFIEIVPKKAK